jgi:RNA-binding protein
MAALQLTIAERKAHRADAHHLNPVVLIGADGLTEGVKKETNAALNIHGLIKVRVFADDRVQREAIYAELCESLSAAPIQHIGKLLILWRPPLEKEKKVAEDRMAGPKDVKVLKYSKRGGHTKAGILKDAKPKQKSVKKRSLG